MALNNNKGMAPSTQSERRLCDATRKELPEAVFSMRSVPRLYNEEQLRLRERLETAVRLVGGWCEMDASLGISCETVAVPVRT
jgi:hypothetical protein